MYNKIKRILALIGVIFLAGLYVLTFVSVLTGGSSSADLFKASIFCTVVIPSLIYGYMLIYKAWSSAGRKRDRGQQEDAAGEDDVHPAGEPDGSDSHTDIPKP